MTAIPVPPPDSPEPLDPSASFFSETVDDRARAAFEAGIKLGALYHLISSFPVKDDPAVIAALERALEASIGCQPFVETLQVRFDRDRLFPPGPSTFEYTEISGEVLDVRLTVRYRSARVAARLQYIPSLAYPLMYIENLQAEPPP